MHYWYGDVLCVSLVRYWYGDVLCVSLVRYWYGDVLCVSLVRYWYGDVLCITGTTMSSSAMDNPVISRYASVKHNYVI